MRGAIWFETENYNLRTYRIHLSVMERRDMYNYVWSDVSYNFDKSEIVEKLYSFLYVVFDTLVRCKLI